MATRAREIDDVSTGGGNRDDRKKPQDVVEIYGWPDKKTFRARLFPGVFSYGGHWVNVKKKDGSRGSFYTPCSAWDGETGERQGGNGAMHCSFCRYEAHFRELNPYDPDSKGKKNEVRSPSRFVVDFYMNAIIRSLQKAKPEDAEPPSAEERKTGMKAGKDSDAWTPVKALRFTSKSIRKLKELKQVNTVETDDGTKAFPLSDIEYGRDVSLKYDKDLSPGEQYSIIHMDPSPLNKAEKKLLLWDLSDLQDVVSQEELHKEFVSWATRNKIDIEFMDEDEDGGKAAKKKTRKVIDEDDEDDAPPAKKKPRKVIDEDDDDEEDVAPKSKKKPVVDEEDDDIPPPKKAVKGKKPPVEDDDDDYDEPPVKKGKKKPVEDDEDDDIPPPKKSVKKPVKKVVDEDDDDDYDEPPVKKGKAPVKGKKPVDDEDEDDEDEDDDIPPPKKSVKKPVKKPVVDEDDDDDDEPPVKKGKKKPVEDDEDDDLPPPKKGKAPVKGKKKPVDDEDEDEDL